MNTAPSVLDAIDHFPVVLAKRFLGDGATHGLIEALHVLNAAQRFPCRVLVECAVPAEARLVDAVRAGGSVTHITASRAQVLALASNTGLPDWLDAARDRDALLVWDDLDRTEACVVLPVLRAAGVPALIATTTPIRSSVPYVVFPASRPSRARPVAGPDTMRIRWYSRGASASCPDA